MKHLILAAAALALSSAAALAGEGGGDIFAQRWSGVIGTHQLAAAPIPMPRPAPAYAQLTPENGSMSIVQTANSLPVRIR